MAVFARGLLIALLTVGSSAAASVQPSGNVEPALVATPPGKVAVVASSAPVEGQVAVIVQNGSARPVRDVQVSASSTTSDGGRATKASDTDLVPATLAPGDIAFGLVKFPTGDVPAGSVLAFKVKSRRVPTRDRSTSLAVGSFVLSPPLVGDVAQTLALKVTNRSSYAINGPVDVRVMCFGEARLPASAVDVTVKRPKKLAPGAGVSATAKLPALCPSYLVAAKGRSAA
jgi:hypothetical protein